jgi:SAM-dependent methyltransferase
MTAKKLGFTPEQVVLAKRSIRDLKFWFSQHEKINGFQIQVIWRLTQDLDKEIGVENSLRDFDSVELARILDSVDAVVTTPSTSMLEAMLHGVPVALLDYNNAPHYVPAAWNITAPRHMDQVLPELMNPLAARMLFQDSILRDALESHSPATPRMTELISEMVRIGNDCRTQKIPLRFPARILADPQYGFHMPELNFDMSNLYPRHPVFSQMDRVKLQVQVNQLQREVQKLEKQVSPIHATRNRLTWIPGPKKIARLWRSVRARRIEAAAVETNSELVRFETSSRDPANGMTSAMMSGAVELAVLAPQYDSKQYVDEYLKPHMHRFQETIVLLRTIANRGMHLIDVGSYGSLVPAFKDILGLEHITTTEPAQSGKPQSEDICLPSTRNGTRYGFHVDRFDLESSFPYADGEFDVVVFTEVLEHLTLDPVRTLAEINRITRKGGWLLVSTPNCASAKSVMRILRGRNPNFYPVYTKQPSRDRHNREYAPWEVRELLTLCGYDITLFTTVDVYSEPANRTLRLVKSLLVMGSLLSLGLVSSRERGDTIFALARKTNGIKERYPDFLYV